MIEYCTRLKKGDDLKQSIEKICLDKGFDFACIISGVGSLSKVNIRLAKAKECLSAIEDYEIVSLIGTVAKGQAHIHIGIADDGGKMVGGHLKDGCIINTTCELILGVMENYTASREFDETTGFNEIVFREE